MLVLSVTVPTEILKRSIIACVNEFARAYLLLAAIRQNIPSTFEISKSWVIDFHSVLDRVETRSGIKLQRFRIPEADLHKETLGGNSKTGEIYYSGKILIDRMPFLTKVNEVLTFFAQQMNNSNKD